MPYPTSSFPSRLLTPPLRRGLALSLLAWGCAAQLPAFAQADPPPSTVSNPAAAAVRTPVAPPGTTSPAPAAPMISPTGPVTPASPGLPVAQGPSGGVDAMASAEARYERERSRCESGASQQDRTTCLREAGAALAEARRNALGTGDTAASRRENAVARCQELPMSQRSDCEARIRQGTVEGSVNGGGVLRELTVIESPAPASPSTPR